MPCGKTCGKMTGENTRGILKYEKHLFPGITENNFLSEGSTRLNPFGNACLPCAKLKAYAHRLSSAI